MDAEINIISATGRVDMRVYTVYVVYTACIDLYLSDDIYDI